MSPLVEYAKMPKKAKLKWADTYRNRTNCNHEQMRQEKKNMNYNVKTVLFLSIPVQLLCGTVTILQ